MSGERGAEKPDESAAPVSAERLSPLAAGATAPPAVAPAKKVERTVLGPGSVFHNWELLHEIGRGGMGVVYKARHRLVGRFAAVKVIAPPPGTVAEPKAIERFHREVEVHVSLRLPNLPEFYDAELFPDGTAVLVLEYLDGKDLAGVLHILGRLPLGDALFIVTEILRPLQVIHMTSTHRDLKPTNVYIRRRPRYDSEGRVEKQRTTVLDFGLAKMKVGRDVTGQHAIVGTKCYMSPEQLKGQSLDGRSDLYAIAIVLYEMLVGHPPFIPDLENIPHFNVVMLDHLTKPFPDLRGRCDCPDDVWAFIELLSRKNRDERPADAAAALAMARELRTKYVDTARLFREDIQDVMEAVDRLARERAEITLPPVTNPMATDRTPEPPAAKSALAWMSTEEVVGPPVANENELGAWPEITAPPFERGAGEPGSILAGSLPHERLPGDLVTAAPALAQAPERSRPSHHAATTLDVLRPNPNAVSLPPSTTRPSALERRVSLPKAGKPTARLSESDERDPWHDELATRLQKKLHAPRVFRRPGLVELSEDLCPIAVFELKKAVSWLGTDPTSDVVLPGAAVAAQHLAFKHRSDRRLALELSRSGLDFPDGMVLDGRREVLDEAAHHSFLRCGDRIFRVEDLVAADPTGELQRIRKRKRRPIVRAHWASAAALADGLGPVTVAEAEIHHTLTLIGSARACQVQLDDGPGFVAAIWLRGDGELELTLLDESKMPHGNPILRAWLLGHGERVPLFGDYSLALEDPPEHSSLQRGVGSPLSPRPPIAASSHAHVRPAQTPRSGVASPHPPAAVQVPASTPTPPRASAAAPSKPASASGGTAPVAVDSPLGSLTIVRGADPPYTVPLPLDGVLRIGSAPSMSVVLPHLLPEHLVVERLEGGRLRVRASRGATFDLQGQLVDAADVPDGGTFRLPRVATFTYKAPSPPPSGLRRLLRKIGL